MSIDTEKFLVTVTLTEPLLGTVPRSREVYKKFIESLRPKPLEEGEEEEAATTPKAQAEREAQGWTGFHTDTEKGLFLYDYQIKGMFKELARIAYPKGGEGTMAAMTSKVEGFVYVKPRRIYLGLDKPDEIEGMPYVERPLRAQTPQGPRVTVMRSDALKEGRQITFTVEILPGPITRAHIEKILEIGEFRGIGQWRTGGYGRFEAVVSDWPKGRKA